MHQIQPKSAATRADVPTVRSSSWPIRAVGTLLSTSLENGTPVEQIADILGHQSVQSTGVYLKSSLGLLSKCALDPDAPEREVSR
jgi:hypothetical protein